MEDSAAPEICNKIFSKTLGKKIYYRHKHDRYEDELTPHTCKCTIYQNELYDMGKARIRFLDNIQYLYCLGLVP